jgi:hypothetical protein
MGDKSPKSTQKKAGQKQTKTNAANKKKRAAIEAKRAVAVPGKKK